MKNTVKKIMEKKAVRILSVVLASLLVIGSTAGVVYASAGVSNENASVASPSAAVSSSISDVVQIDKTAQSDDKEETVYAIADANGNVQRIIVSDWLKNPDGAAAITDYTELSDIENTEGDETYTTSDDNTYVWNAGGSDIHYQGTTQKQLPVTVSVRYYLDGNEISPEELAGKSGHVTIRFNYTNTETVDAQIDGKTQQIYVPFLMVSGVALDNENFSNVTVSSGSVMNDGSRSVIVGYALPGLSQSLDITDEGLDIPEYVEIEADTTNFSLAGTLTVGLTGLFDNVQINADSDLSELSDSLNDLENAALDLVDGTSDLYAGCSELYDNCEDLQDGVAALLRGADDLSDGADDLSAGMASLHSGLGRLSGNSASLDDGAKQLVDEVFATATTQLRAQLVSSGLMAEAEAANITLTRSNYVTVFQQLSVAATVTPAQVEAQLRATLSANGITDTAYQDKALTIAFDLMAADSSLSYTDAVTEAANMLGDALTAQTAITMYNNDTWKAANTTLIGQVAAATGTDNTTAAQIAMIAYYLGTLDGSNATSHISGAVGILSNVSVVNSTASSTDKISALCTAIASAATSTGNAKLDAVKDQLDDVMEFYNGLLSYTGGVDSAYAASGQLADGAASLADGADDLYDGVYTLYAGSKALVSGVGELTDGSLQLKDGAREFYDEGIEKLMDALDGDYQGLIDRLCAVADAGRDYQSFAGIADGMTGSVKFIYRTDSIGD